MKRFNDGDKVVLTTNREIKTLRKAIKNDILIIYSRMAKGGYSVTDVLGSHIGTVRHSDIKPY